MLDNFLNSLPNDPYAAAGLFAEKARTAELSYEDGMELFIAFRVFIDATRLPFKYPELGTDKELNLKNIRDFFSETEATLLKRSEEARQQRLEQKIRQKFDADLLDELNEEDFENVRDIIRDLKTHLKKTASQDSPHRIRRL